MRLSRSQLSDLADERESSAARLDRAAQCAGEAVADPLLSDGDREQAATYIPIAEGHAREFRREAAALRSGVQPDEL